MLPTNLSDLNATHIENLIYSEVPESLTLEYKQQLPSKQSEDKKEFVYDIAAMANAAGGDLVYGLVERRSDEGRPTGVADHLLGTRFENIQDEIVRLSSYIRDGITPRLSNFQMQPASCAAGDILVIRIPSSWNKPHMVTMDKVDRFYKRTGTTKNQMSIDEIRRAFSEQGELREIVKGWREHRAALIEKGNGPILVGSEVAMLFHVIPARAFTPRSFTETWRVSENEQKGIHVANGNYNQRYNADGFLCYSGTAEINSTRVYAYTQLFRSGIVEYAFSNFFYHRAETNSPVIIGQVVEQQMVHCYKNAVERFRRQGEVSDVYVGFSLVGIEGKRIFVNTMYYFERESLIRQNVFTSPEIYVDLNDPEEMPFKRTLRPLVDTFWQLDGREGTPFIYQGEWDAFRRY